MAKNIQIDNQALTQTGNYEYKVPSWCLSLALNPLNGNSTMHIKGEEAGKWTLDSSIKELFEGQIARAMRGETLVFNSVDVSSNIEIRAIG